MPDARLSKLARLRLAMRPAWSTWVRKLVFAAFVLCLINLAWSAVGTWEINLGGESYHYVDHRWRSSGVQSIDGLLLVAVRRSFGTFTTTQPANFVSGGPNRAPIPWAIRATLDIGPGVSVWHPLNGLLDGNSEPHEIVPGLIVTWDRNPPDEWYNRVVAIHWGWLTLLTAILPIWWILRAPRIVPEGCCRACGYDLCATPDRCPECGTVPDVVQA